MSNQTILIDTNVIIDVISDDPQWADWSLATLEKHSEEELIINPAVYSELCFGYETNSEVDQLLRHFRLGFQETPKDGLFRAAKAFQKYKQRGGTKDFVLPDFFIGGHAESTSLQLMTRDVSRYQSYFPNISLIKP